MDYVVTTGKRAAAFQADDGEIIYVLFEETYEPLVSGDAPSWDAISIGTIDHTLRKIFLWASGCKEGSMEDEAGLIAPDSYIADWIKELAAPVLMQDMDIRIEIKRNSYTVNNNFKYMRTDEVDAIMNALATAGLHDVRDRCLAGEPLSLQLYKDAKVIVAVNCGNSRSLYNIFDFVPSDADRNHLLGYAPVPAEHVTLCQPAVRMVDEDERLLQREDGSWYAAGSEDSAVADFIENLWQSELREPGGYPKLIKAYREALAAGTPLPSGTKVVVNATVQMEDDQRRWLRDFTTTFPVTSTPQGFEVEVTQENVYNLMDISPVEIVTWVLPEELAPEVGVDASSEAATAARRLRP